MKLAVALMMLPGGALRAQASAATDLQAQVVSIQMTATRTALSACLLMTGDDKGKHTKGAIAGALELADALPSPLQRDAPILSAAARGLSASARQLAAGDYHSVVTLVLLRNDAKLETGLSRLADALPVTAEAANAAIVRAAQAQNIRAHQVVRDMCFLWLGIGPPSLPDALRAHSARFDEINTALTNGDPARGWPPASDLKVKYRLGKVAGQFDRIRPTLDALLRGDPIEIKDLRKVSVLAGSIDREMVKLIAGLQAP